MLRNVVSLAVLPVLLLMLMACGEQPGRTALVPTTVVSPTVQTVPVAVRVMALLPDDPDVREFL